MPETQYIERDSKTKEIIHKFSDKDWNAYRFDEKEATKIANFFKGEVQFRPADPYFGQKFGQTGQRDGGYIVKVGNAYLIEMNWVWFATVCK